MLFRHIMRQAAYEAAWRQLDEKLASAEKLGLDHCNRCGFCCWQRPCAWSKEEFAKLAEATGRPAEEIFRESFVVDKIGDYYVLLPRRVLQADLAGSYVPASRTYDLDSPCVFLEEGEDKAACVVYVVQPKHASGVVCKADTDDEMIGKAAWSYDDLITLGWDGIED